MLCTGTASEGSAFDATLIDVEAASAPDAEVCIGVRTAAPQAAAGLKHSEVTRLLCAPATMVCAPHQMDGPHR
jgi:hypothetical protein